MYNNIKVKNIDTNIEIEFNNIFLDDTIKLITQKIAYLFHHMNHVLYVYQP